ncbi:hypothetical protein [Thiobacillus sp.]
MRSTFDPKLASNLAVISGIPAGDSGTGRFVAHLEARMAELAGNRIKLITRPERPALWQIRLWLRNKAYKHTVHELVRYGFLLGKFWAGVTLVWLRHGQRLILLHPQNAGYRLALRLLESRKEPPLIYLLDSSFFCVVSYNHLQGENGSCLRCIDFGFGQMAENGCQPFPRPDPGAIGFAPRLRELVKAGRVKVAAQNLRQAELAQRHFGLTSLPPVVGLWTQDWDEIFSGKTAPMTNEVAPAYSWDVLFHGYCLDAKGASWTAKVAAQCPELRFMFPFARPDWFEAPANCSFVPCSWERGLREELGRSRFVAVPSLWSAPIEGALVKSIACARAVVVVNNPTSYCDELPDGLVLKLPWTPAAAAVELRHAIEGDWRPDAKVKSSWLAGFAKGEQGFVPNLLDAVLSE